MPRFFFDFKDAKLEVRDGEGVDFSSHEEARKEGLATLAGLVRDRMCASHYDPFAMDIRDESGQVFFTATLTLDMRWTDQLSG
ncbi:DUF6894 family protein [Teichococcus vastitatis]|uniref:DUF6894 family protein n=1 Tax=Teichococcus vastitatis TaxID=2307076 RepID=UPI000E76E691|nr:hypothetical protein [Pseudoroseomonas vastitatis]